MITRKRAVCTALAVAGLTLPLTLATTPAVAAAPSSSYPVVRGLDDPYGLQFTSLSTAIVAENTTGEVSRVNIDTGHSHTLISGLPAPAGVAQGGGKLFVALGGPNEQGPPPPGKYPPASVLVANTDGSGVRVLADLLAYELKHNPDGQRQFVDGKPVDALSNPFSMAYSTYGLLVADGGGNDILRIDPATGRVSTFFVPPTINTGACKDRPNNPGTVGCDSVPTAISVVNGSVYVATLGAEAPGAGRVYRLDARTGKVQRVYKDLTSPTGLAVTTDGTLYVGQLLHGAPSGPPGPGFDPSKVGRILKIAPDGTRTSAQVTMPIGLQLRGGALYSTAWSVAGAFLGAKHAGQVVKVRPTAFS